MIGDAANCAVALVRVVAEKHSPQRSAGPHAGVNAGEILRTLLGRFRHARLMAFEVFWGHLRFILDVLPRLIAVKCLAWVAFSDK
jgi:hypothetical protein